VLRLTRPAGYYLSQTPQLPPDGSYEVLTVQYQTPLTCTDMHTVGPWLGPKPGDQGSALPGYDAPPSSAAKPADAAPHGGAAP
jgi:hypothetical protein